MSRQLISLNPDLRRLVEDGYDVSIVAGYLVLRDVPYLDGAIRVRRGMIASPLDLAGDRTVQPTHHIVWFVGEMPHGVDGTPLDAMAHHGTPRSLGRGLLV
ncbi:MAG: DUF6791 domain-containing protein, partial [Pseudomonadota bacterium]|nr:DUF6791 domain-containing protein [Pseudomonadota bacterium]